MASPDRMPPSMSLTGPRHVPRRLPQGGEGDVPMDVGYTTPARPTDLAQDASLDEQVMLKLLRRRLNPSMGYRRL